MPAPGTVLSAARVLIGVGGWAAPVHAGKAFGLDPDNNPQGPYIGRLFAIRDLALAVVAHGTTGQSRKLGWQVGIACDAADLLAASLAARNGSLSKQTAVLAGSTAFAAIGLGAAALYADDEHD